MLYMAHLEWIDLGLSNQLPVLRDRGEGQHLEFMVRYPENGHDLSKEIAAFASSNAGTILIGVQDDGSLAGLDNIDTPEGRDRLCRRVEGVCSGNVRPAITPVVKFAREGDAIVLAIEVPRGKQPIYYSRSTPYIRHLSRSRPAEPHEVIERVADWLATTPGASAEDTAHSQFFSSLASTLIDILIYGEEFEQRAVNPWLDLTLAQLAGSGNDLRQLATDQVAIEGNLDPTLRAIADKLDAAASHVLTLGGDSWRTLESYVAQAVEQARQLKDEQIDTVPLSAESIREVHDLIRRAALELADLDQRAAGMVEAARMDEVQDEASRIGYRLLRVSHYRSDDIPADLTTQLLEIGRDLHLVETERLYMDGGQSVRAILERLHSLAKRLQSLAGHQP
jgi:ATP-dependent DNA helicase RecG